MISVMVWYTVCGFEAAAPVAGIATVAVSRCCTTKSHRIVLLNMWFVWFELAKLAVWSSPTP